MTDRDRSFAISLAVVTMLVTLLALAVAFIS
jgi:hypothetical protein